MCFGGGKLQLQGYFDSDLGGDLDTRRSTSAYVFKFAGAAISWASRLQKSVAHSSTEAEYMALSEGAKEMIWLQRLLSELGYKQNDYIFFCDSSNAIFMANNHSSHRRSKHIDIHQHFIRHVVEEGKLQVAKIDTKVNPADALTKSVTRAKFEFCQTSIGLVKL